MMLVTVQNKQDILSSFSRSGQSPFGLIHIDIWGLYSTLYFSAYLIRTIVDDYTHATRILFNPLF